MITLGLFLICFLVCSMSALAECIPVHGQWIAGQHFASAATNVRGAGELLPAPDWRANRTVTRMEASRLGIELRDGVERVCFERASRHFSKQDILEALNGEAPLYEEILSGDPGLLPLGRLEVVQATPAGEHMHRVALKVVYAPGRSVALWVMARSKRPNQDSSEKTVAIITIKQGDPVLILVPLEDAVLTMQSTALSDSRDGTVEVRLLGSRTHRVRLVSPGRAVLGG